MTTVYNLAIIIESYSDTGGDGGHLGGMKMALWASLEEQIGLIAACLPCLKSVLHRALQRLGLMSMTRTTETSSMPSVASRHPSVFVRTRMERVGPNPEHLREDSPGSEEEGLVDLAWKDRARRAVWKWNARKRRSVIQLCQTNLDGLHQHGARD